MTTSEQPESKPADALSAPAPATSDQSAEVPVLETPCVALDTQTFYQENFGYNTRKMRELKAHVANGTLKLYLTDINAREARAGITKRVGEAAEALSGKVRKQARILSNLPSGYELLFDSGRATQIEETLVGQFEQFLKDAAVQIIPSRDLRVGPIFDLYFAAKPPFEATGEKKSEFPDAVSVAAAAAWGEQSQQKLYVISNDAGVRAACEESPWLIPLAAVEQILARATATHEAEQQQVRRLAIAQRQYFALTAEVRAQAIAAFESLDFFWSDYDYADPYVVGVEVDDISLSPPLLTDIDESIAYFDLSAAVQFEATVHYDDPDATHYDREDGETHVFNRIHAVAKARIIVPVAVELAYDPDDKGQGAIASVDVNNGRDIPIVPDEVAQIGSDLDDEWKENQWES